MKPKPSEETVVLSLTREETDALLALLLRTPETESLPAQRIEQLLFRVLRKVSAGSSHSGEPAPEDEPP